MKVIAPLFVDASDAPVLEAIDKLLDAGEGVMGLQETGKIDDVSDVGWLLTTTRRTLLLVGDTPGAWHIERLSPGDTWSYDASLGRDVFRLGTRKLFRGPLIGGDTLRRVFELASMEPTERVFRAAVAHREAGRLEDALVLFSLARERLEQKAAQDEDAVAELHQTVFELARLHFELEQLDEVKSILEELTILAPEDNLVESSRVAGLDDSGWWELLAESHREAGDAASAAAVYGILTDTDTQANRHVLEHARALSESGDIDGALDCYTDYLAARRPAGSFRFIDDGAGEDKQDDVAPWLDIAREALALAESEDRVDARFELALEIVRLHPARAVGYTHLLAVLPDASERQALHIERAREILWLLDTGLYDRVTDGAAPPATPLEVEALPKRDDPIEDGFHDEHIVHPEERVRSHAFGKMLGKYVSSDEASDARLHCEIIRHDTYPAAFELTERLAQLAGVEPPELFISHQRAGVRALGKSDDPFLLVAAAHLDPESPRHLSPARLCFALATQIEHIRAGHLILTEAEYHQSLKKKGIQSVFAAVEMLPMGSLLSKTPISKIAEAVSSFKDATQRKWLTSALDFAESKSGDAFGWATSKLRKKVSDGGDQREHEVLVKEQVAAFVLGAIFTADRMGLVACDSLPAAVGAMMRISSTAFRDVPMAEDEGLLALFDKRDDGRLIHRELAMRVSELFDFALSAEYLELRA